MSQPPPPPRRPPRPPADRPAAAGRMRRQVRAILSSPPRLRQAFLLGEVLGPPVALRRDRPPQGD